MDLQGRETAGATLNHMSLELSHSGGTARTMRSSVPTSAIPAWGGICGGAVTTKGSMDISDTGGKGGGRVIKRASVSSQGT